MSDDVTGGGGDDPRYHDQMPDGEFIENYLASFDATMTVAARMARAGYDATVVPPRLRERREEAYLFSDKGDIYVRMPVQVKQIKRDWTCAEDFPFPMLMIDEERCMNRVPLWFMYWVVNKERTHAALIHRTLRRFFVVENHWIPHSKCYKDCVMIPRHMPRYVRLSQSVGGNGDPARAGW